MKQPCEDFVPSFLKNLRYFVTVELKKNGFNQHKIARLLGITQPAVSMYLSKDFKPVELSLNNEIKKLASSLAINLSQNRLDEEGLVVAICDACLAFKFSGSMCQYHYSITSVPQGCKVCMKVYSPKHYGNVFGEEKKSMLLEFNALLDRILNFSRLVDHVPEVQMNVVYSTKNPSNINDVIGIPGRIIKIKNTLSPASNPQFGGSQHTATVLLAIKKIVPRMRCALTLRYSATLLDKISELELPLYYTKDLSTNQLNVIFAKLKNILTRSLESDVLVLVDTGDVGIEPIIYLVASDLHVLEKTLKKML